MDNRQKALNFANQSRNKFLGELHEFLRIPSISTNPENKADIQRAAEWVFQKLTNLGFQNVAIHSTEGHPIVYGEYNQAKKLDAPTVLIYGHYDVQPSDPDDLWESPPFEPTPRGDHLYARGASDMKGQIAACIFAIESILNGSPLPINVKFMIEGEEEIGSPNLNRFMETHKELLQCDVALNPDSGMISADTPTITYALRGLAYFEIRVYGPDHDLHSGLFGGIVHNPAQVLSDLIAGMHDQDGRITLPGFYDRVRPLTEEERSALRQLPMDEQYYLKQTGVPALHGEKGFSPVEQVGARPTLDVNGLYSGFTGVGQKTVIPSWAMAKISMRLVPDQDPAAVFDQLKQYLLAHAPKTVRWDLIQMPYGAASISDINHPATKAMVKSFESVWNKTPLFKREGGSIPVVGNMQRILAVESVLTGFGLADDNIHSPNEKLHLPTWYRGISTLIHFFYNYSETELS
ncbi:MAG: dipeptidase [Chloroflexota bacterium]|jgi:acetylornithine deacetylase/succinyl-diaminopimelate desuccinylase-like protein